MNKYPFIVTVYRRPGTTRPVIQQHSFEDIGVAHLRLGELGNDTTVFKTALSITLKEVTYYHRLPKEERHG